MVRTRRQRVAERVIEALHSSAVLNWTRMWFTRRRALALRFSVAGCDDSVTLHKKADAAAFTR